MPTTAYHPTRQELVDTHYKHVPRLGVILNATVRAFLRPTHVLVDAGCGSMLPSLELSGPLARFCVGVGVERPMVPVPVCTAVTLADLGRVPFAPATFDLGVSRSVVEPLADPVGAAREIARVLRPGGRFVFTTPNRYCYSSLGAASIPYRLKSAYMRWVFGGTAYDHFPVFYRANTRRAIRGLAARVGLRVERLGALRHFPFSLVFSPVLFRLGILYDHVVTRLRFDARQSTWLAVLSRP